MHNRAIAAFYFAVAQAMAIVLTPIKESLGWYGAIMAIAIISLSLTCCSLYWERRK